jgi:hypothetical protein
VIFLPDPVIFGKQADAVSRQTRTGYSFGGIYFYRCRFDNRFFCGIRFCLAFCFDMVNNFILVVNDRFAGDRDFLRREGYGQRSSLGRLFGQEIVPFLGFATLLQQIDVIR